MGTAGFHLQSKLQKISNQKEAFKICMLLAQRLSGNKIFMVDHGSKLTAWGPSQYKEILLE